MLNKNPLRSWRGGSILPLPGWSRTRVWVSPWMGRSGSTSTTEHRIEHRKMFKRECWFDASLIDVPIRTLDNWILRIRRNFHLRRIERETSTNGVKRWNAFENGSGDEVEPFYKVAMCYWFNVWECGPCMPLSVAYGPLPDLIAGMQAVRAICRCMVNG